MPAAFFLAMALNAFATHAATRCSSGWDYRRVVSSSAVSIDDQGIARFVLDPDTPKLNNGQREELTAKCKFFNGDTVTIENWTRTLGPKVSGHPESMVVTQWHETLPLIIGPRRPPLAFRLHGDHLIATVWNDEIYATHGADSEGVIVGDLKVKPKTWYHFRYAIKFDSQQGWIRAEVQSCPTTKTCPAEFKPFIIYDGGLGYSQAKNYYLKFGVYTSKPFSKSIGMEHLFRPEWIVSTPVNNLIE